MQNEPIMKKPLLYKTGMLFIIVSIVCWVIPIGIPFLELSGRLKAVSITGSLIMAEVLFWIGALMVGKEVAGKVRKYLNPRNWRKRNTKKKGT